MTRFARAALVVGLGLLVWLALDLILLLFGGILLAIFLRALACGVTRVTPLSPGWALAVVVVLLIGGAVLAGWLYAPRLAEQSDQLAEAIPTAVSDLTSWLRQYGWGRWILEQFQGGNAQEDAISQVTTFARRLATAGVAFVVIVFTGVYLAAEPASYLRGVLRLVPPPRRRRAAEVLYATGHVLRWWLLGQALAMAVVGLAMGIGLWLIGVQLAFILGVLAGLFEFIPFIGPMLAVGPALLIALANDTRQAAYVLVLYAVVQTGESYVVTPLVQRKAVELPPVITIAAQVGLSWAAGPIGLLVAVPLTAVAMVWTQMIYVDDRLGDCVAEGFEATARGEVARDERGVLRGLLPA